MRARKESDVFPWPLAYLGQSQIENPSISVKPTEKTTARFQGFAGPAARGPHGLRARLSTPEVRDWFCWPPGGSGIYGYGSKNRY